VMSLWKSGQQANQFTGVTRICVVQEGSKHGGGNAKTFSVTACYGFKMVWVSSKASCVEIQSPVKGIKRVDT
jgi:hypothetical protein